jgi:hypothetical protein
MSIDAFLARCAAHCDRTGISRARLSTIIFGSGVTLDRLHQGKGVTVRVLERAAERLDEREKRAAPPISEEVHA